MICSFMKEASICVTPMRYVIPAFRVEAEQIPGERLNRGLRPIIGIGMHCLEDVLEVRGPRVTKVCLKSPVLSESRGVTNFGKTCRRLTCIIFSFVISAASLNQ